MAKRIDFVYSEKQEPHRLRTKKILQQHPEVRELIGKNKYTIFAVLGLVLFQVALAWLLKGSSWWLIFGAAYLLGAFADHSLFVMIHECAHHLLFKSRAANRLAGILANLPQLFPSSISFERYHIKHHSFQGIHELDADLPNRWEARLINNYFIGKCIWLMFYPLFQIFRINRLREIKPFDGWVALNWGLEEEHYLTDDEHQETHSYYGWLNVVAFNVGHHNEHHDFPSIPWNKLPRIRKTAPEYYNTLYYHTSWIALFFRFLFDKEISLFHRIIRKERGKVALTDVSTPDRDLVDAKTTAMTPQ
jgi:sphingolipid delta-4 desaturase